MTGRRAIGCLARLRKEMEWKAFGLNEYNPDRFATTSWMRSQYPFLVYRFISVIYSTSVLIWSCYIASKYETEQEIANWFLSYPTWGFIIFSCYQLLAFLLTSLNFYHDCLCNDDLSWYHKVCWVLHIVSFNSAITCAFGTFVNTLATSANNESFTLYTAVFTSSDINFYAIVGVVMIIDVFLHSITVRLLHFVYASGYFLFYFLIHLFRWAANYTTTFAIFDFGAVSSVQSSMFVIFIIFFFIPVTHSFAYGIDTSRQILLFRLWKREYNTRISLRNSNTNSLIPSTAEGASTIRRLGAGLSNPSFYSIQFVNRRSETAYPPKLVETQSAEIRDSV